MVNMREFNTYEEAVAFYIEAIYQGRHPIMYAPDEQSRPRDAQKGTWVLEIYDAGKSGT